MSLRRHYLLPSSYSVPPLMRSMMECTGILNIPPEAPDLRQARIRLFMNLKNAWLIAMYEKLGFTAAGRVTLEKGFRANALNDSVPIDTRESEESTIFWHTRFEVAMEQVVRLG